MLLQVSKMCNFRYMQHNINDYNEYFDTKYSRKHIENLEELKINEKDCVSTLLILVIVS